VIRLSVAGTLTWMASSGPTVLPQPSSNNGGGGSGGGVWLTVGHAGRHGSHLGQRWQRITSLCGGGAGGRLAVYLIENLFAGTLSAEAAQAIKQAAQARSIPRPSHRNSVMSWWIMAPTAAPWTTFKRLQKPFQSDDRRSDHAFPLNRKSSWATCAWLKAPPSPTCWLRQTWM